MPFVLDTPRDEPLDTARAAPRDTECRSVILPTECVVLGRLCSAGAPVVRASDVPANLEPADPSSVCQADTETALPGLHLTEGVGGVKDTVERLVAAATASRSGATPGMGEKKRCVHKSVVDAAASVDVPGVCLLIPVTEWDWVFTTLPRSQVAMAHARNGLLLRI